MAEYAERDILKQGNHYMRHVAAMTAEGLHNKSDIAAELAHRDMEIARLKAAIRCERESGVCFAVHDPDREPCTADNCDYMQPNTCSAATLSLITQPNIGPADKNPE